MKTADLQARSMLSVNFFVKRSGVEGKGKGQNLWGTLGVYVIKLDNAQVTQSQLNALNIRMTRSA